jgi:molybdopterin/thiamine biosynthesis adenylyltransferase
MNIAEYSKKIVVIQVGCGGTGSWLVPLVSKLLNNIKLRLPETTEVIYKIVDDDVVDRRNILRQNFSEWDIGKGKAMSLISRYCYNFENMVAIPNRIKTSKDFYNLITPIDNNFVIRQKSLVIVIGCVDNNKSRQILNKLAKYTHNIEEYPIVYIDSGNLLYNGQIVTMSYGFNEFLIEMVTEFEPDRAEQLTRQIKKRKKIIFNKMFPIEPGTEEVQQSCAFFGDQSQSINSLAATMVFCNLQKILVSSEIPPNIITFNSSGYSTFEV